MDLRSLAFAAAVVTAPVMSVAADPVEVAFTGAVVAKQGLPTISIGDPASGSWVYDALAPSTDIGFGLLFDTDSVFALDVNGIVGSATDLDVRVVDVAAGPRDQLDWTTFWNTGNTPAVSGPIFELENFFSLRLSLVDGSGLSLTGEELPATIEQADWDLGSPASRLRISYDVPVCCTFLEIAFTTLETTDAVGDSDEDGIPDDQDNCIEAANPGQQDTNGDGYGNLCDPDLNNDGIVNPIDLGLFKFVFFTADPDADFNSDGIVNPQDLGRLKLLFFQPPGPSAFAP